MTPDDQLSAFLGEQPTARRADIMIVAIVRRIERRAFVGRVAAVAGWAGVVGVISWACAPALKVLVGALAPGLAPAAAALALVAVTLLASGAAVRHRLGLGLS